MCLVQMHDYAALKLRGLPFNVKYEDVLSFFKDYDAY